MYRNFQDKIEQLVLELITSEGEKTLLNYEEKIITDLQFPNKLRIELLEEIRELFSDSPEFRARLHAYAREDKVKRAESLTTSLINHLPEEELREKLTPLLRDQFELSLPEDLLQKILSEPRETRCSLFQSIVPFTEAETVSFYCNWVTTYFSVRSLQDIHVERSELIDTFQFEIGVLCSEIVIMYSRVSHPLFEFPPKTSPTYNLFKTIGHDLAEEEQFAKYGLLEIVDDRELLESFPRILDHAAVVSVDVTLASTELYSFLRDLHSKYKFKLSLRPDNISCFPGIERRIYLKEAIEYGKIFETLSLFSGKLNTKLRNAELDAFWASIKDTDLIFEELLNDFIYFDNYYVTNMIHIVLLQTGSGPIIQHLDHEYILYTEDEFARRQKSPKIKGTGRRRVKTFKIDNATMPLDIKRILLPIMILTFKNKQLVLEYFGLD
ncbi:hypothetical protein [Leptonema illini]|uniref:Uncharacterized protein n=1 Tax=Leptonema illini DSM 21528 TaxID=929563 RepID=H2CB57_9LEPT|nr:hypothetical protein [Leptonema illini]EHQ05197.1 hypothetical protein Lepil_0493 [Leptonema illini DSM 21528]